MWNQGPQHGPMQPPRERPRPGSSTANVRWSSNDKSLLIIDMKRVMGRKDDSIWWNRYRPKPLVQPGVKQRSELPKYAILNASSCLPRKWDPNPRIDTVSSIITVHFVLAACRMAAKSGVPPLPLHPNELPQSMGQQTLRSRHPIPCIFRTSQTVLSLVICRSSLAVGSSIPVLCG